MDSVAVVLITLTDPNLTPNQVWVALDEMVPELGPLEYVSGLAPVGGQPSTAAHFFDPDQRAAAPGRAARGVDPSMASSCRWHASGRACTRRAHLARQRTERIGHRAAPRLRHPPCLRAPPSLGRGARQAVGTAQAAWHRRAAATCCQSRGCRLRA